ncbi:MAG: DUF5675 family protein [Bacteroidia bacterium]|jgi:hypothetical protein|nr:DUF5675 family protein [Bacteroidia bacterium]
MELELLREYFPEGTNGEIWHDGKLICKSIELPWKENAKRISCIPEGRYPVVIRWHKIMGWVLSIEEVPERKGILVHAANSALKDLKGCIAPVTQITGKGKGSKSKVALNTLLKLLTEQEESETHFITIKSKTHEPIAKITGSNA